MDDFPSANHENFGNPHVQQLKASQCFEYHRGANPRQCRWYDFQTATVTLTKTDKLLSALQNNLDWTWTTLICLIHKVSGSNQGRPTCLMSYLGFDNFGLFDPFSSFDMTAKFDLNYAGLIAE